MRGGAKPGIYVADLDAEQARRLLPDISSAHPGLVADPDGMIPLLFARDGKLMAQRFNLNDYQLNGEPKVLRKSVHYDDRGALDVSLSRNGLLVYRSGSYRFTDSRTAWFDRSGKELASVGKRGMQAPLSLSPTDGSYAYVNNPAGGVGSGDLWLYELARNNPIRLTHQGAVMTATTPVWSPDGNHIAYTAYTADIDGARDLFSIDALTGKETALYTNSYPKFVSDWSRDGHYVIFTELHPDRRADIWMLPVELNASGDLQAGEPAPVADAPCAESAGQISPDGNWIAYTANEVTPGQQDVFVQPFPPKAGGGQWRISVGDADSLQPRWSPNGNEIFYLTGPAVRSTLMSVRVTKAVPESREAQAVFEVSSPKRLFDVSINGYHPSTGTFFYSVARDGERFLINFVDITEEPVLKVNVNWEQLDWPEP